MGNRARVFSGISPCAGPWGYRHGGRGRRGGGTCSPSPVSHTPTILLLAGIPCPRLRRSAPAPPRGRGSACDIRRAAVSGSSPGSPHAVDRGDIATGGGGSRGGGTSSPSPVSNAPTTLLLVAGISARDKGYPCTSPAPPPAPPAGGYPYTSAGTPSRAFAEGYHTLLPASPSRAHLSPGKVGRYPVGNRGRLLPRLSPRT